MFSLNPYIDLYVIFLFLYLRECVAFVRPHRLLGGIGPFHEKAGALVFTSSRKAP